MGRAGFASLPAGTTVNKVDLADAKTSNVAVTGVDFRRDHAEDRERVAITARLVNRSAECTNGSLVAGAQRSCGRDEAGEPAPNAAATVEFAAAPLPAGTTRGVVKLADDQLPRDNSFYFAISRWPGASVLVIDGREGGAAKPVRRARSGHR
jgi:hypothetical protein